MNQEVFQQFFKDRYQVELVHTKHRAVHYQWWSRKLELFLIVLSATTTILLAVSSFFKALPITPITAIVSAFVTAIATGMKALKTQEKWSFYQTLFNNLNNEYYDYKAQISAYEGVPDKEALFVERVQSLLGEADKKMPLRTLPNAPLSK